MAGDGGQPFQNSSGPRWISKGRFHEEMRSYVVGVVACLVAQAYGFSPAARMMPARTQMEQRSPANIAMAIERTVSSPCRVELRRYA